MLPLFCILLYLQFIIKPGECLTRRQVGPGFLELQQKYLLMFERLGEPLSHGPRGSSNTFFRIENGDEFAIAVADRIRDEWVDEGLMIDNMFYVTLPNTPPDLTHISATVPRIGLFSHFLEEHRDAATELITILLDQPSTDEFISTSIYSREKVNLQLWTYAVTIAALNREDMKGIRAPGVWEVMPDSFLPSSLIRIGSIQAKIPLKDREVIQVHQTVHQGSPSPVLDEKFTGSDSNPEHKLWYFREDLGINSHHWHWHQVFHPAAPLRGPGSRDRKGEMFFYMHRSMLARYEAERICNGLTPTKAFDLARDPVIEKGYFSHLTVQNSGLTYGGRQDNTPIRDISRLEGATMVRVKTEDLRVWKDRIQEGIDTGLLRTAQGLTVPLSPSNGTDVLGALIENGGKTSLNPGYYGSLHNQGHNMIARMHDPENLHNENPGVMTDPVSAMRDPIFYGWHTFIDGLFERYKRTLPDYTPEELLLEDICVRSIQTVSNGSAPNVLTTHWGTKDINLSRGLDFGRISVPTLGPILARVTHLDHEPFDYNIVVDNYQGHSIDGTVRVFMAPRFSFGGERLNFMTQRNLFFELDKFVVELEPGVNSIKRPSTKSSITIPWNPSFYDIEKHPSLNISDKEAFCGCGWPQHMLLPKGTPEGTFFDLFVMVTDGHTDFLGHPPESSHKSPLSFCGLRDEEFPDTKAMGFPFDRVARKLKGHERTLEVQTLEEFIAEHSNMMAVQVKIVHRNQVIQEPSSGDSL